MKPARMSMEVAPVGHDQSSSKKQTCDTSHCCRGELVRRRLLMGSSRHAGRSRNTRLDVGKWPFSDITRRPKDGGFRTRSRSSVVSPGLGARGSEEMS